MVSRTLQSQTYCNSAQDIAESDYKVHMAAAESDYMVRRTPQSQIT